MGLADEALPSNKMVLKLGEKKEHKDRDILYMLNAIQTAN